MCLKFKKICHSSLFTSLVMLFSIIISASFFSNDRTAGAASTFMYFSGAANFSEIFHWQVSPSDYDNLISTVGDPYVLEQYQDYKHQKTEDLIPNTVNNYGYVLVALASQNIFPFLGDLRGVIWLQLSLHLLICLIVINFILLNPSNKFYFILFYAANPLIIHFVTFPFYYFWLFLPSFFFAVLVLKKKWLFWWVYLSVPVLIFSLLIRPTTLFLAMFFFFLAFFYARTNFLKINVLAASLLFVLSLLFIFSSSSSSPWHTIYVGIGAYPNSVGVAALDDTEGFKYFFSQTKVEINAHSIAGNWNDPLIRETYMDVLKNRYFEIVSESPFLLLRNAVLNTLQVFSIGFIVDRPIMTSISTFIGFFVFTFLVYTRQFVWILAILASASSFALYFPPIPAYNFAAYLLLVLATNSGLNSLCRARSSLSSDSVRNAN